MSFYDERPVWWGPARPPGPSWSCVLHTGIRQRRPQSKVDVYLRRYSKIRCLRKGSAKCTETYLLEPRKGASRIRSRGHSYTGTTHLKGVGALRQKAQILFSLTNAPVGRRGVTGGAPDRKEGLPSSPTAPGLRQGPAHKHSPCQPPASPSGSPQEVTSADDIRHALAAAPPASGMLAFASVIITRACERLLNNPTNSDRT